MRVLVSGGTGVVGRPVVDLLLQEGHQVRLLSRHARRDVEAWPEGRVETFEASVADPDCLRGAAEGCDAILHAAGIVAESPPEVSFQGVNVEGTEHLLQEASRAGVGRFVYVSSLGAERGESGYHRSKREAEARVRDWPGDWVILRPGNVYGPGDTVISQLLTLVRISPAIPLVGLGDQPFQPVAAEDLAGAIVQSLIRPDVVHRVLEIAGPERTTTLDVLRRLEQLTETSSLKLPIPAPLVRLGVKMAEGLGLEAPVSEDQLIMLEEENVLEEERNALVHVFHIQPTPLDEGLRRLLDRTPEQAVEEGTGELSLHHYWVEIRGASRSPEEIIRLVRERMDELTPDGLLRVGVEPFSSSRLDEGDTVTLQLPMRGHVQVRVERVTPREVVMVTLVGHPLAGAVQFLADQHGELTRFQVRTYTRSSNLLDHLALKTVGEPLKNSLWISLVQAVAERSGGEILEPGVRSERVGLEGEEARAAECWIREVVQHRQQEEAREEIG